MQAVTALPRQRFSVARPPLGLQALATVLPASCPGARAKRLSLRHPAPGGRSSPLGHRQGA